MSPSQLSICNRALRRIHAGTITDINERSLAAENCRDFYPQVIAKMLEMHDWNFANQRVQMALAGTNDRPFEWLYAYGVPANCAQPLRVLPDLASAGVAVPVPLPGQPYAEAWSILEALAVPYEVYDGILYTNAEKAWLDYTINDITGVLISQSCADAAAEELACFLAVPVKSDSVREKELAASKEILWQQAIAADNNRQPQTYGDYISETEIVRHSGALGIGCQ